MLPLKVFAKKSSGTRCFIEVIIQYYNIPPLLLIFFLKLLTIGGEVPRLVAVEGHVDEHGK
jgi:hypothetical protein